MYQPLAGFFTALVRGLSVDAVHLPITADKYRWLAHRLTDHHSYLLLQDGRAVEVVKVRGVCGKLVLDRAAERTVAKPFPCGAAVLFVPTMQGVRDMVCEMKDCEENTMIYAHMAGFMSTLTDKLADIDTDLPVPAEHLALLRQRIPDGGYTVLRLFDGTQIEYVKVINNGGALRLERGQELTPAAAFPNGACVRWELTPAVIRDIVCQMPCCD